MSTELSVKDDHTTVRVELDKIEDFESIFISSKVIADQTGKSHGNIIRDICNVCINMAGGKSYVENVVTGGKTYSQYKQSNLLELFNTLVVEKSDSIVDAILHPKYFQGVTWKYRDNGQFDKFTLRGDVALHILSKYDDNIRWDMIDYMKLLMRDKKQDITNRVVKYIKQVKQESGEIDEVELLRRSADLIESQRKNILVVEDDLHSNTKALDMISNVESNDMLVKDVAKLFGIKQKTFYEMLYNNGQLINDKHSNGTKGTRHNFPNAGPINNGWMIQVESSYWNPIYERYESCYTTRITPKGKFITLDQSSK